MQLYLIGSITENPDPNRENEVIESIIGITDDLNKAENTCTTENHFVMKLTLNEIDNPDITQIVGEETAWYPFLKKFGSSQSIPA